MFSDIDLPLWLSPGVLGLLGLCIGSFLNVVIHRLPIMMERDWWLETTGMLADAAPWQRVFGQAPKPPQIDAAVAALDAAMEPLGPLGLVTPRSRCPHCGHQIRWFENLPVIGWLMLRGRCSSCRAPISPRYPLVEAATGLMFAGLAWKMGPQPQVLLWCGVVAVVLAMALIDFDTFYLPDSMNQPLLWAGLIAAWQGWTLPLPEALAGALAGYLSLWSISQLFKRATGRDGMGAGDFKLLAAFGAWLGWQAILPIALMASVVGVLINVPRKLMGKLEAGQAVPFGPYLAGGGLVVIFVGVTRCLEWIGLR